VGEFAQPPFTSCLKVPFHCAKSWQLLGPGQRARGCQPGLQLLRPARRQTVRLNQLVRDRPDLNPLAPLFDLVTVECIKNPGVSRIP
jgi:hypothetical protein